MPRFYRIKQQIHSCAAFLELIIPERQLKENGKKLKHYVDHSLIVSGCQQNEMNHVSYLKRYIEILNDINPL